MGGRFNFLYCKDVEELLHDRTSLDAMRAEIANSNLPDILEDHDAVVELLTDLERSIGAVQGCVDRLKPVWKAIEHERNREEMKHIVDGYRKGQA